MNNLIYIGYVLNISSNILFLALCIYFYYKNAFSFIELSNEIKNEKTNYGYISLIILTLIPFCSFIKCLINVIIITSNKTVQEKVNLIKKFRLIKGE